MAKESYNNFFALGHNRTWQDAAGKLVVLGYLMDNLGFIEQQKLLDIGCGDSFFLSRIFYEAKEKGLPIEGTGIDISKEAIKLAQFLCSDASSYMNGQNIVMDGGRSAW